MSEQPPRSPKMGPPKTSRGLGRGLSALFGDEEDERKPENLRNIAIEQLKPSRFQPRRHFDSDSLNALAESVREQGILQPILVRRHPSEPNTYEILAGERRWRAAQAAQLHEVPAIVREMDDRAASEIALIENIQRQDLNAVEEGEGYHRLIEEFGYTQDELGRALGKSRSHIANTMRLLTLPDEVKAMIADGRLTAGHARALVTVPEPLSIAREVVAKGLSVRDIEALARARRDRGSATGKPAKLKTKDANVAALERELTQRLGLKVAIAVDGDGGTLSFHYRTLDQLDVILGLLRMDDLKRR
jgi:ParB family chromosome partitioning protein